MGYKLTRKTASLSAIPPPSTSMTSHPRKFFSKTHLTTTDNVSHAFPFFESSYWACRRWYRVVLVSTFMSGYWCYQIQKLSLAPHSNNWARSPTLKYVRRSSLLMLRIVWPINVRSTFRERRFDQNWTGVSWELISSGVSPYSKHVNVVDKSKLLGWKLTLNNLSYVATNFDTKRVVPIGFMKM